MSADASVNQTLMGVANGDWFTVFARNEVVLAYDPTGRFAADFQIKPWYEVLQEPGIKLGRYDPNLTANFPDGHYDAAFYYRSDATFDKTPFVSLPDQINLDSQDFTSQHAQASYTTNIGQSFRSAPIQVSVAPLRGGDTRAADEVIQLLGSAQGRRSAQPVRFPARSGPGRRQRQPHTPATAVPGPRPVSGSMT